MGSRCTWNHALLAMQTCRKPSKEVNPNKLIIVLHPHKAAAGYGWVQPTATAEMETFLAEKILSLNISIFCSTIGSNMLMGHKIFADHTARYWEDLHTICVSLFSFKMISCWEEKIKSCVWERKRNMHWSSKPGSHLKCHFSFLSPFYHH